MNFTKTKDQTIFSLEFCHIYTNEIFSAEHKRSLDKAKLYSNQLGKDNFQLCVLIDNYNSTEDLLDLDSFFENLRNEGLFPDYYAFESDMAVHRDELLNMINDKTIKKNYRRYINGKDKLPCSFMTAIWYFVRLGVLDSSKIVKNTGSKKFTPATDLINVLPERFRAVEAKTRELIEATPQNKYLGSIDYMFFDSLESFTK